MFTSTANLAWEWLEEIAACSTTKNSNFEGVTRLFASPEHALANEKLTNWMQLSGMEVRTDNAANLIGCYSSKTPNAKTFIFGSHQDTVPNGGKYDGILGIILPIAMINYFHSNNISFPFHIEVISFSDEEGTRFQSTLIGSKTVAGTFSLDELDAKDTTGVSMRQALVNFGCQPDLIPKDAYKTENLIGFVELHIEQGPRLEIDNLPLGIVSGITGIERHQLYIFGKAGHAGTVPMNMRQDTLVGAAQIINMFNQLCMSESDLVGVVGKIENYPNGINVIPERTNITIELRSPNDDSRLTARSILQDKISELLTELKLRYELFLVYEQAAISCSKELSQTLASSIEDCGIKAKYLFSGAGHDGLAMHSLTNTAMLFMRCKDGVSHHPSESIKLTDLAIALNVIQRFCILLAEQWRQ